MKRRYSILVTGCGGDIGQSIGKILKSHPMFGDVIGCDMDLDNAAKFIFDKILKVPACTSKDYFSTLSDMVRELAIDIILPISEPELRVLSQDQRNFSLLNTPIISANADALKVGFDKFATAEFLKNAGLPHPETTIVKHLREPPLPLILKSREGSGSKAIFLLKDYDDFEYYKKKHPDFIAQEYLSNESQEYTCGLFRSRGGEIRSIIYNRRLTGGFSGFGTVENNEQVRSLIMVIAEKLKLVGSINIQLRMSPKGPCVFEINPRFSSTVRFRHMMGFEDVIWSIQDSLNMEISPYKAPPEGTRFYKGFYEYID